MILLNNQKQEHAYEMQFQMVRGPKPLLVVSIDTESVLERADLQEWVEDKWRKNKGAGIPDYISASAGKQTASSRDHRELPSETE